MEDDLVLSYEEITSVDTIDDLIELYTGKSMRFQSDEDFISQVSNDWESERDRLWERSIELLAGPLPDDLPKLIMWE